MENAIDSRPRPAQDLAVFAATRLAAALEMGSTSCSTDELGRPTLTFTFTDDGQHRLARKAWQGYAFALIDRPASLPGDAARDSTSLAAALVLIADASFELRGERLPAELRECLQMAAAALCTSAPP